LFAHVVGRTVGGVEYLVERYLPGICEADLASLSERSSLACEQMAAKGIRIRYLGSTFLGEDETCLCRFDAPSLEAVVEANRRIETPFARVLAARQLAPRIEGRSA
jgi:hypothetical protein